MNASPVAQKEAHPETEQTTNKEEKMNQGAELKMFNSEKSDKEYEQY